MEKINFKNGQAPYINDTNLNQLQENIEEAIDSKSSLPAGGITGQVLAKASNLDNDVEWINQTGGGEGSVTGDTLPIGSIVDYDGTTVPENWKEVEEKGEIYSTEETKTNKKWIDGKPIYRKVFTLPNIASSNKQLVNSSVSVEVSYDKITKITGIATIPDGILPIPYMIGPEQFITCFLESNQNKIFVYCRSYTTMDIKIFLEYTKTTD